MTPDPTPPTETPDLMEALAASVEKARASRRAATPDPAPPTPDDEDEREPGWPPRSPEPPTERDGRRVGDRVTLVAHHGARYPVEIVAFTLLEGDAVVRWLGLSPSLHELSTVDLNQLAGVESQADPAPPTGQHNDPRDQTFTFGPCERGEHEHCAAVLVAYSGGIHRCACECEHLDNPDRTPR